MCNFKMDLDSLSKAIHSFLSMINMEGGMINLVIIITKMLNQLIALLKAQVSIHNLIVNILMILLEQDDFYEQIAKQYQYKNPSQKDEDEQEDQNIKIVQNIEINEEILNKYPQNKSLRIYYSNMDYNVNQYKLLKKFQESNDGIINVIPTINEQGKKNGEGHFILKDKQSAKKLIKTEGKIIFNRPIYYQAQTIQELLFDPIDQKYLEEQFPEIQKKYVLKQQKIQKIQQNINKQIVKQQKWLKYTFDCEIFKSGKVFKNWLKSFNLQLNADYRNLHLRKYNEKTIGSIQIRQSMVKNFLNHEFENKIVEFKSDI